MSEQDDLISAVKSIMAWAEILLAETEGPLNEAQVHDVNVILKTASQELGMLDQASEVLARMRAGLEYSSISHDLRAPFNGFLGYSKMMLSHPQIYGVELNEAQRRYLEQIHATSHQLLDALNEIFDYASIKAGHIHHSPSAFDLAAVISEVADHFSPYLEARLASDLPQGFGDEYRTKQAISNTVRWLRQASPDSVIQLDASALDGGLVIAISVSGESIPAVNPGDLFDPDTGLTLPVARALVEIQGGTLNVESAPGVLTFYATIPAVQS